jgi:hypothetical protein
VVKDDGLAAGKGVVVTTNLDAARAHACTLLDGGHPVLLEAYLDGPEVSLFCLVDGADRGPLLPAQDFKRVGDGDRGPNTGGMGAYAPLPWAPPGLAKELVAEVVAPVAAELERRGTPFSGCCTRGWRSRRPGPRWWSSTAGSATRRPRSSSRSCAPRSRPPARHRRRGARRPPAARLGRRGRRDGRGRGRGLPGKAAAR